MNLKLLVFCIGFLFCLSAFSQNDTLVLTNGDRIVGELKKMDRGVLIIKTPYSSSDLKVKWKKVRSLSSVESFLVITTDGQRYKVVGFDTDADNGTLVLNGDAVNINDIVFVKPVKDDFKSRLNATMAFGFNLSKASNLSQLTLDGTLGYTSDYCSIGTTFNAVRSNQDNVEEIQRTQGELSFNYFLKNDNFLIFQSEYLSNSEQKLKMRLTNKLGFGTYFIHSNQMFLAGALGIAYNVEDYTDTVDDNRNSGEAFAALEVNLFDLNDLSLISGVTIYPSLTEKKRVRTDFKIDLKYDLPLDLFVKLGFNYNYDSKPVEGASYDDYIFRTTVGWEL
ncbi:DUF481 domain-containing protein [Gelidibacter maritimus]|uniref:DUF481 domain-containing protein n=1 Tax=Gelidibacter maritimus TaxID=2761487 RepID=A0A7W2R4Z9_9FLAO|nr:DUF481 domain-containing protein [Gelidibacter maritimus]MBA6154379.1 DUF481 domain-containing protein [Gelidibacter maritimus]